MSLRYLLLVATTSALALASGLCWWRTHSASRWEHSVRVEFPIPLRRGADTRQVPEVFAADRLADIAARRIVGVAPWVAEEPGLDLRQELQLFRLRERLDLPVRRATALEPIADRVRAIVGYRPGPGERGATIVAVSGSRVEARVFAASVADAVLELWRERGREIAREELRGLEALVERGRREAEIARLRAADSHAALERFRSIEAELGRRAREVEFLRACLASSDGLLAGARIVPSSGSGTRLRDESVSLWALLLSAGLTVGLAMILVCEWAVQRRNGAAAYARRLGVPWLGDLARRSSSLEREEGSEADADDDLAERVLERLPTAQTESCVLSFVCASDGESASRALELVARGQAAAGKRVVVVDTCFERPRLHEVFGCRGEEGILDHGARVATATGATVAQLAAPAAVAASVGGLLQETEVDGLSLLAAGSGQGVRPILEIDWFGEVLDVLRGRFDLVLCDTPALCGAEDRQSADFGAPDAALFQAEVLNVAEASTGVVLVVDPLVSSPDRVRWVGAQLHGVDANVVGLVSERAGSPANSMAAHEVNREMETVDG